jgi:anti-sigma B factor antagonist
VRPLARLEVERRDPVMVAALEGEIDASNAGEIAAEVRTLVDNRDQGLLVDLTPTAYLDSAGINLLFTLGDDLRARQMKLVLVVAPGSAIARMLSITSLDRAYPTYATVEEALQAGF